MVIGVINDIFVVFLVDIGVIDVVVFVSLVGELGLIRGRVGLVNIVNGIVMVY